MKIEEIDRYFRELLPIADLRSADVSMNGVQVACSDKEITRVGFAVDACMESFQRAATLGIDLLFVHHGLFWGAPLALSGSHYRRVKFLLDNDIALYAAHLPLDMHSTYGNNAGMASALDLDNMEPFGLYRGFKIGMKGSLPTPLGVDGVLARLGIDRSQCTAVLAFGPEECRTVGIVSGGGTREVEQAIAEGLDLYITGDALHQVYHTCLEERLNLICGGHYQTEVWGVRLVASKLAEDTGIETQFIDVPTGL
jgi:dinuclear metal center YbgI/SA1388 family protein